jgi:TrmH family RNA methyltransferase
MLTLAESDRICVVLVSTRNPLNIGAAARAMQNFGFHRLRVVNPYGPAYRGARSAVGASTILATAEEFYTVASAIADCTVVVGTTAPGGRQFDHQVMSLESGTPLIVDAIRQNSTNPGRAALLFGSEKSGLSNEALSYCHWRMQIPTQPEQPSMNLGQAVAVCLYELARGKPAMQAENEHVPASADDLERATGILIQALQASGYFDGDISAEQKNDLRRMIRRFNLSADDATHWLGMLRQILWKLNHKS